jgi:hypothetical protein
MPQTYRFQITMPIDDTLPRNRATNVVHLEHSVGAILPTDQEAICADIVAMYQAKYGNATREVECTSYDVDAVPNYPNARVTVNEGVAWPLTSPHEIALVLSFSGPYKGNKNERGRIFLIPGLYPGGTINSPRPTQQLLDWALGFYTTSNESFPDIGGVDWKFGVYSRTLKTFRQSTQAWVNDDWDVQRRRGLRETTRVSAQREG